MCSAGSKICLYIGTVQICIQHKYGVKWYEKPLKFSQLEALVLFLTLGCNCGFLSLHTKNTNNLDSGAVTIQKIFLKIWIFEHENI